MRVISSPPSHGSLPTAARTLVSPSAARLLSLLLTLLNFLNYIDRSILFAVQPQIQAEFHITDSQIGLLTSAFFFCYMCFAPFVGPLADRFPRKYIMALGAIIWSVATLLTAFTHSYTVLLVRHTIVGIGEATFVTITPSFVSDLFEERFRGRIMAIFYVAIQSAPPSAISSEAHSDTLTAGVLLFMYVLPPAFSSAFCFCSSLSRNAVRTTRSSRPTNAPRSSASPATALSGPAALAWP